MRVPSTKRTVVLRRARVRFNRRHIITVGRSARIALPITVIRRCEDIITSRYVARGALLYRGYGCKIDGHRARPCVRDKTVRSGCCYVRSKLLPGRVLCAQRRASMFLTSLYYAVMHYIE